MELLSSLRSPRAPARRPPRGARRARWPLPAPSADSSGPCQRRRRRRRAAAAARCQILELRRGSDAFSVSVSVIRRGASWFRFCFSPARSPDTPGVAPRRRRRSALFVRVVRLQPRLDHLDDARLVRRARCSASRSIACRAASASRALIAGGTCVTNPGGTTRWREARNVFVVFVTEPGGLGFDLRFSAFAAAAELASARLVLVRARPPGGFRNGDAGARAPAAPGRGGENATPANAPLRPGPDPPPREAPPRGRRRRAPPGGSACASSEKKGSRLPKTSLPKTSRRRRRAPRRRLGSRRPRASGADARRSAGFADCSSSRRLGRPPTRRLRRPRRPRTRAPARSPGTPRRRRRSSRRRRASPRRRGVSAPRRFLRRRMDPRSSAFGDDRPRDHRHRR